MSARKPDATVDDVMRLVFSYGVARVDVDRGNSAASNRACNEAIHAVRDGLRNLLSASDAELHQAQMEVWRQGSRFNCVVLDKPPLPDRGFYRSNAEFLKACGEAVDAFMERSVVQGRARDAASSGARGPECALVCQEHTAGRARGVPACDLGACKRTLGTEGLKP